jgi:hypothetical protein
MGRAANFIVLCDFVSARCRTPFCRAPWQVRIPGAAPHELDPRPPPRHPTAIGREKAPIAFD